MANSYVSVQDLFARYDYRTMMQLSNDSNANQPDLDKANALLDDAASYFESLMDGRYNISVMRAANPMPSVIKRFICNRAADAFFGRRNRQPDQIAAAIRQDDAWINQVVIGRANLPTIQRQAMPQLIDSSRPDGSSAFDFDWGYLPSPFGPEKCPNNPPIPLNVD